MNTQQIFEYDFFQHWRKYIFMKKSFIPLWSGVYPNCIASRNNFYCRQGKLVCNKNGNNRSCCNTYCNNVVHPVPSKRRHANDTSELNTARSRTRLSWCRKQVKCNRLLPALATLTDGCGSAPFRLRKIKIIAISLLFALNFMSASSKDHHLKLFGPCNEPMLFPFELLRWPLRLVQHVKNRLLIFKNMRALKLWGVMRRLFSERTYAVASSTRPRRLPR